MGDMRDQYEDGRYDSTDVHDALIERLSTDGVVVLPGGWSVPADQIPGFPFNNLDRLLTPQRGGMQYPATNQKETPMAKTLNQQLATLKENQKTLACQIEDLQRKVNARRTAPPAEQYAWMIDVRFNQDGQLYTYLIYRKSGMFWTTGQGEAAHFKTWAELLDWLDTMVGHSALIPLRTNSDAKTPLEGRRG